MFSRLIDSLTLCLALVVGIGCSGENSGKGDVAQPYIKDGLKDKPLEPKPVGGPGVTGVGKDKKAPKGPTPKPD